MILFVLLLVMFIVIGLVVLCANLSKREAASFNEKLASLNTRGHAFRVVAELGNKRFLVDDDNKQFMLDINGRIYTDAEVFSYNILSPYSLKGKQYVSGIFVNIAYLDSYNEGKLSFAIFGYDELEMRKASAEYSNILSKLRVVIDELNKLTERGKQFCFASAGFCPDKEIVYGSQYFGIDLTNRLFAIRAGAATYEVHSFSEFVKCKIHRDNKTETVVDFGSALVGSVIAGRTGAVIMGRSTETHCYDIQVVLSIRQDYGVDESEIKLLDNGYLDTSSYEYEKIEAIANEICDYCKYISKHK